MIASRFSFGSATGLSALPSFSRRHRVPAGNRHEDEKPGAFAPQRRESLACSPPPLLVLSRHLERRFPVSNLELCPACHPFASLRAGSERELWIWASVESDPSLRSG